MVCELQFLMDFMIEAKKRDHALYEITRTETFVKSVAKLNRLFSSPKEQLLVIAQRGDERALAKFMVNHQAFDLFWEKRGQFSLIHYVAQCGEVKPMKLLLSSLPKKKSLKDVINMSGASQKTPLILAASSGRLKMTKVIALSL